MIKALLLIVLTTIGLFGQANYRSLQGATGKYGSVSVPAGSPWSSIASWRIESRVASWTGTGRIMQVGDYNINMPTTSTITATSFADSGSPTVSVTIPNGATDVIIRVQRTSTMWGIELWRSDGSEYVAGSFVATSGVATTIASQTLAIATSGGGSNIFPGQIAWFRMYSTAVSRESAMPTNVAGGSLVDYEFEGNGTDGSANALNLTMTGSPSYPSTAVVPLVGPEFTVGSGRSFQPDCSGTAADSYKWRYQGNIPLSVQFSSTTNATPTITGLTGFGQATLTCEATINGVVGTSSVNVGVVSTNDAGVVIVPDATLGLLLGPMLRNNVSEWTWPDWKRIQMGDYWYAQTTQYTTDFTIEGANYYDACLVQYQNYYRTGLTRFQTIARACADKWWSQYWASRAAAHTCDDGTVWINPRQSSILGITIRAYEQNLSGSSDTWACLNDWSDFNFDLWVELRTPALGATSLYTGAREPAYSYIAAIAMATAHPTSMTRSAWATRVSDMITNQLRALQCTTGQTYPQCTDAYTKGAGTITVTNGSATVTGSGTAFLSFFANGNTIAFQENGGSGANFYLTISSRSSDTSLTLSSNYTGTTSSGRIYALRNNNFASSVTNNWRWEEYGDADLPGYTELTWHTALMMEAMFRAYLAGINTSTASQIITDYETYMRAQVSNIYTTAACTGSFGNTSNRTTAYANWSINGNVFSGCTNDSEMRDTRQSNSLPVHVHGYNYYLNATSASLTAGDDKWSSTFGSFSGTGSDGFTGLLGNLVNSKWLGQSARNASYTVTRLGSTSANITPVAATHTVKFTLSGVTSAAKIKITITMPSGATATNTCTSSPCTVSGLDTRQGTSALRLIQYLSSGDVVLATGDQQPITLQ